MAAPKECNGTFRDDKKCEMELKYTIKSRRGYMCKTHQLWAYEFPVKIVSFYDDGTEVQH